MEYGWSSKWIGIILISLFIMAVLHGFGLLGETVETGEIQGLFGFHWHTWVFFGIVLVVYVLVGTGQDKSKD